MYNFAVCPKRYRSSESSLKTRWYWQSSKGITWI